MDDETVGRFTTLTENKMVLVFDDDRDLENLLTLSRESGASISLLEYSEDPTND